MKIRLITSLREFDALASVWRAMTAQSGQTSPFVSHDWFASCWRTAGPNRRREAWVFEDAAGPVAFLPLVHERSTQRGLPARVIRLLDFPDTPFTDFPVAGDRSEVVNAFLKALEARGDWDILVCPKLVGDSPTHKAFDGKLGGTFLVRVVGVERSSFLRISGTWEQFVRQKSQRFRRAWREMETAMRAAGEVAVEEHRRVDPDGPLFAELTRVSRESWLRHRGPATSSMPEMPPFFREFTRHASANDWLHLWIMRINGHAVATEYQVRDGDCLHVLRADFKPSSAAAAPAAYLRAKIIEALFERRTVHEYHMGSDGDVAVDGWASGAYETVALEVYAPTTYGKLLHGVETRLVPLARRFQAALSPRSA